MTASDVLVQQIVEDILKQSRTKFTALINAAIDRALANLNAPPPVDLHTP